jgi:hypothetical protein
MGRSKDYTVMYVAMSAVQDEHFKLTAKAAMSLLTLLRKG